MDDTLRVEARIALLHRFLSETAEWSTAVSNLSRAVHSQDELRRIEEEIRFRVDRMVIPVKHAVEDAGLASTVDITAPPAAGGRTFPGVEVFEMWSSSILGQRVLPVARRKIQQAIGFYESLSANDGLVNLDRPRAIDVLAAIRRALRPAFKKSPPENEKAVQDQVETILNTLAIEYHREKERAPVGPTTFIPDFTVEADGLAIEVKLANEKHSAADVQREIAEDVTAYGTKWHTLLFVIYDCGAIQDPDQFCRENQKHFRVTVLIVKH